MVQNRNRLLKEIDAFAERCVKGGDSKITREQYLTMCESLGEEPNPEVLKRFTEITDFPEIAQTALTIYNNLSDNYIPGDYPTYLGKDKSSLLVFFDIYGVEDADEKSLILQIINIFDSHAVAASRKRVEAAIKKSKMKSSSR